MTFRKRQNYEDSKKRNQWLPGVEGSGGRNEGGRAQKIFRAVNLLRMIL